PGTWSSRLSGARTPKRGARTGRPPSKGRSCWLRSTPERLDFVGKQGIPWEVFQTACKPVSEGHDRQETPLFAKGIELDALRDSPFPRVHWRKRHDRSEV